MLFEIAIHTIDEYLAGNPLTNVEQYMSRFRRQVDDDETGVEHLVMGEYNVVLRWGNGRFW